MKNTTVTIQDEDNFYQAILSINTETECKRFLRDLLTEKELEEFMNRWKVVKLLDKNVPYKEITEQTGMSSTTIARISKWLRNGKGGYQLILDRMKLTS